MGWRPVGLDHHGSWAESDWIVLSYGQQDIRLRVIVTSVIQSLSNEDAGRLVCLSRVAWSENISCPCWQIDTTPYRRIQAASIKMKWVTIMSTEAKDVESETLRGADIARKCSNLVGCPVGDSWTSLSERIWDVRDRDLCWCVWWGSHVKWNHIVPVK